MGGGKGRCAGTPVSSASRTNPDGIGDMIKIGRADRFPAGSPFTASRATRPIRILRTIRCAASYSSQRPDGSALRRRNGKFPAFEPRSHDHRRRQFRGQRHSARASAAFNIRFNDRWTAESLMAEIARVSDRAAADSALGGPAALRPDTRSSGTSVPSHVFLTRNNALIDSLSGAVEAVTGAAAAAVDHRRHVRTAFPQGLLPRSSNSGLVGKDHAHGRRTRRPCRSRNPYRIYETFIGRWFGHARCLRKSCLYQGAVLLIQATTKAIAVDISESGLWRSFTRSCGRCRAGRGLGLVAALLSLGHADRALTVGIGFFGKLLASTS